MPTLTHTWTSSQNNACADQTSKGAQVKEILLDMKTKMVAAGWTVTQSSDSSTADSSDNWSATTDIVRGSGAHSWVVLRSPANWPSSGEYIYFAIDWRTGADEQCFFASRGDADWTGLSTSTGPTSSSTNINPFISTSYSKVVPGTLADCKFHSHYSDEGDFIYYVSNSTSQQANYGMFITKCVGGVGSDDKYPVIHFNYGSGSTSATSVNYSAFYHSIYSNQSYAKGFQYSTGIGSGSQSYGGHIVAPGANNFWNSLAPSNAGDSASGKIPLMPLFAATQRPTDSKRYLGIVPDIWACQGFSSTAGTYWKSVVGDVSPGTGTITHGCIGGVWVPCSVAPDFT